MTPDQAWLVLDILHTCRSHALEVLQIQGNLVTSQNRGPRSYAAIRLRDLEREYALCDLAVRAVQADYPHVAENPHLYAKACGAYE